jgi:hypothetical protein
MSETKSRREPKPRRRMTFDERCMARALAKVTMIPGIRSKGFARDMEAQANGDCEITEGQAAALRSLVIRFRRQIPADVVTIARVSASTAPIGEVAP